MISDRPDERRSTPLASNRGSGAFGKAPRGAEPAPSLAELRMRAIGRLRLLSAALAQLQQEQAEAAAECARLRAVGEPEAVGASEVQDQGAGLLTGEPTLEPAAAQINELEQQLARKRAEIEAQQASLRALEEARSQLEQELEEAQSALAEERSLRTRLEERTRELISQLNDLNDQRRLAPDTCSDSWPQRAAQLQLEVKRALTENDRLRDEMAGLLRFLEELSDVLTGSRAGVG